MMNKENQMIYGIRPVIEALNAGDELEKVFVQKNLQSDVIKEMLHSLQARNIPVSRVPLEKLNRFTRKNHQGVVGFVSPVHYHDLHQIVMGLFEAGDDPFVLVLDRITDVRNFGGIARSASAAGVHAVVIPAMNAAQINADAVKTSAGALSTLPVCRVRDLKQAVQYLRNSGLGIVGCTEKGDTPLYEADMKSPVAMIMGSEEDGISPELMRLCDKLCFIPMKGPLGSLNVSAAAAIASFEVVRQRQ